MAERNPYQPPTAQVGDRFQAGPAGGTLEGGVAGAYDFKIGAVLGEAWRKTKGLKGAFWAAAILIYLLVFGVSFVLGILLGLAGDDPMASALGQLVVQLVLMALIYPFMTGLIMLAVRRSVDLPVSYTMAFGFMDRTGPILLAAILMTLLTFIGFLLLFLPGIYLSLAYALTLPLIAEKGLGAWRAMEASRRAITRHWFKFFGLLFVMALIVTISAIPLGIGLIWTYPMMMNVLGIVYREAFGVEAARMAG